MAADCEVFIVVDAAGDYAVGVDADAAKEKYSEDVGELADADGFRLIKVTVSVPLPAVLELTGSVPETETGELALTVVSDPSAQGATPCVPS